MRFLGKVFYKIQNIESTFKKAIVSLSYNVSIDSNSKISKSAEIKTQNGGKITIINSQIDKGVRIIAGENAEIIIESSYIGMYTFIIARKKIVIKQNCQIAEMVTIRDQDHKFGEKDKIIAEQGFDSSPIIIGKNVWIGSKATLLKGVTIGENTVVGAHSLVTKNCEKNSVYVGVPAKLIND